MTEGRRLSKPAKQGLWCLVLMVRSRVRPRWKRPPTCIDSGPERGAWFERVYIVTLEETVHILSNRRIGVVRIQSLQKMIFGAATETTDMEVLGWFSIGCLVIFERSVDLYLSSRIQSLPKRFLAPRLPTDTETDVLGWFQTFLLGSSRTEYNMGV